MNNFELMLNWLSSEEKDQLWNLIDEFESNHLGNKSAQVKIEAVLKEIEQS